MDSDALLTGPLGYLIWWGTGCSEYPCWKVYNTTPSTDKCVRVGKVERAEDALQSMLKIKKTVLNLQSESILGGHLGIVAVFYVY